MSKMKGRRDRFFANFFLREPLTLLSGVFRKGRWTLGGYMSAFFNPADVHWFIYFLRSLNADGNVNGLERNILFMFHCLVQWWFIIVVVSGIIIIIIDFFLDPHPAHASFRFYFSSYPIVRSLHPFILQLFLLPLSLSFLFFFFSSFSSSSFIFYSFISFFLFLACFLASTSSSSHKSNLRSRLAGGNGFWKLDSAWNLYYSFSENHLSEIWRLFGRWHDDDIWKIAGL